MRPAYRVSKHAVDRYRERVSPGAEPSSARLEMLAILADARLRPRPRKWTPADSAVPGTLYAYSPSHPGLCLVVRRRSVRTVITRAEARRWRALHADELPARRGAVGQRPTEGARQRKEGLKTDSRHGGDLWGTGTGAVPL